MLSRFALFGFAIGESPYCGFAPLMALFREITLVPNEPHEGREPAVREVPRTPIAIPRAVRSLDPHELVPAVRGVTPDKRIDPGH